MHKTCYHLTYMDTQLLRYLTLPPIPRFTPVSGERVAPSGWSRRPGASSAKFQAIMTSGKEEIRRGEGIEHDEFWAEVEVEAEGQG